MNCIVHPEKESVAFCRNCGKAMCSECVRDVRGMVYCEDCLVDRVQGAAPAVPGAPGAPSSRFPYTPPAPMAEGPSPALAMFLGFIPGVGAIYNGQFAKAFLHVVVFGMLISLANSHNVDPFEPLFGFGAVFFVFYMAGEAYHTARRRQLGQTVDEWSGLLGYGSRFHGAGGAVLLIALGVIFLLDTMGVVPLGQIMRYWPVILIVFGVMELFNKLGNKPPGPDDRGFSITPPPES